MQLVILAFYRPNQAYFSVQEKERLRSASNSSGKIVDALTEDAASQERLHRLINRN